MPDVLHPEDYVEPRCVLCGEPYGAEPKPVLIPRDRVLEKFDTYMAQKDYASAERHMQYWLAEAEAGRDKQGQFQICNELMGYYRKIGKRGEALDSVRRALKLVREMHMEDSVTGATALLNAATVYDAFGMAEKSVDLFRQARVIYERELSEDDPRRGGLYNNMALALAAVQAYDEAQALYLAALRIMENAPRGKLEQAITYLNLADAVYAQLGAQEADETVQSCLETAQKLLDDPAEARDGYYAFVCEKCACAFRYHGWFLFAGELEKRAEDIYAGA